MTVIRVSCPGHARHWFSHEAWCDRCGAPNPRCSTCGAATHARYQQKPEATVDTLCAQGHHHTAPEFVKARQVQAAIYRDNRRRDRALNIS